MALEEKHTWIQARPCVNQNEFPIPHWVNISSIAKILMALQKHIQIQAKPCIIQNEFPISSMREHFFLHKDLHGTGGKTHVWWGRARNDPRCNLLLTHYVSVAPFGKTEACLGYIFHAQNLLQRTGHPWYGNWEAKIGNNEAIRDDKAWKIKKLLFSQKANTLVARWVWNARIV